MLEEQAMRMSTWSRSLNKDWVNEQQHRMNVRRHEPPCYVCCHFSLSLFVPRFLSVVSFFGVIFGVTLWWLGPILASLLVALFHWHSVGITPDALFGVTFDVSFGCHLFGCNLFGVEVWYRFWCPS